MRKAATDKSFSILNQQIAQLSGYEGEYQTAMGQESNFPHLATFLAGMGPRTLGHFTVSKINVLEHRFDTPRFGHG